MAENYTVNYNINVNSAKAQQALVAFQTATQNLTKAGAELTKFQKKIDQTIAKFNLMAKKTPMLDVRVSSANKKLNSVITKLQTIERLAKKVHNITVTTTTATGTGRGSGRGGSGSTGRGSGTTPPVVPTGGRGTKRTTAPAPIRRTAARYRSGGEGSPSYRALGPTMIDTGGIAAIDMLKGMGIAYGITGLGSLLSNAISESVAYDNLMQTTKNILGTHDKRDNFGGRFAQMERNVRNVGKLTKYTTSEVADAARFLAMAGFDIEAINQSIRPITNIALVGDTELGETADLVTNVMTGYNISPGKVRKATDIMTMTFTSANTTLTEIAEAYKYSASLLSEGGVSFEEATAAMGVLGNAGIKGSQAGTSMRTILANLVNPRSVKRAKAWEEVGVERFDENGNLRNLSDIFEDLNKKNLDVSMYYRLFDRTAAQGAISLAANVDVWNEIIRRNFMSDNLAQELADEKINTITGLWEQLLSTFEDQALKAFEGQDSSIRNLLKDLTEWIDSDEMLNTINHVSAVLLNFIKMIVDFTKKLIDLYHRFEGFINLWIKLQLQLSMLLIPLRAVRSLLHFGKFVVSGAKEIGLLVTQFGRLFSVLRSGASIRQPMQEMWGSVLLPPKTYLSTVKPFGGRGLQVIEGSRDAALYRRRYGGRMIALPNFSQGVRAFGMGVGSMAGGALGAYIGSNIGEQGSGWNMAATVGLGLAGTIGGSALMSAMPAIGTFLISNPVGWGIAAVAAITGVTVAVINAQRKAKAAQEAFTQFANSVTMVDGVLTGESRSRTEQYLELVYNKQLSLTEVVQRRVNLLKEELGLQDPENVKSGSASIDNKAMLGAVNTLNNLKRGTGARGKNAVQIANQFGAQRAFRNYRGVWWYDMDSYSIPINNPDGKGNDQDALAALTALYYEGVTGSEQAKIKQEFQNRLAYIFRSGGTLADINEVKNDWLKRYGTPSNWEFDEDTYPSNFNYNLDKLNDPNIWTGDKTARSYTYKQGLYDTMVGIYGPLAPIWRIAEKYMQGVESGNLNERTVLDYISMMDNAVEGAYLKQYSWPKVEQWASLLGYSGHAWNAMDGNPAITMAMTARASLDRLLEALSKLATPAQEVTSDLSIFATQLRSLANGFIWKSEGGKPSDVIAADGAIENAGDIRYKYDKASGMWQMVDEDGKPITVAPPVTNEEFRSMQGSIRNNHKYAQTIYDEDGNPIGTVPGDDNNSNSGASSGDYQSHYSSGNAAPKQVVVTIENLMNVESIDLSNPDNAAVIANLKGQLAQALIDVVHDFDETWHG